MSRDRGVRGLSTWPVLLSLMVASGCSRPVGMQSGDGTASREPHPVPFHNDGTVRANSQSKVPSPVQVNKTKPETGLPFRDDDSLPAGTLLTVRLKSAVAADSPGASGRFEAVMEDPVVIEGTALVPRGAGVEGRIESSRVSNLKRNRGYLRLTLDSIDVDGKDLPVQTSSLFVRGTTPDSSAKVIVINLEKGRRLTFRLAEPVYVVGQQALTGR